MSLVGWALSLTPILLGLLSFTAFVGNLRKTMPNGKLRLTKSGKAFLTIGFLGVVGSLYINSVNYFESKEDRLKSKKQASQIDKLVIENEEIKSSYKNLISRNQDLTDLIIGLNKKLESQDEKLLSLAKDNLELLSETKSTRTQLSGIQNNSHRISEYERIQADSSLVTAEIAKREADRKDSCLSLMSVFHDDDDMLALNDCGDFIAPKSGGSCVGDDGPGGPCYDGPGGPLYSGPGGACYDGPGGACYRGLGGSGRCSAKCQ